MSTHAVRPRRSTANIFLSYRREDSAGHAGRLFDRLSSHFPGRLFMDVDTLEPGVDFVDAIEQAVGSCEVLIVVIGREWLTLRDAAGHRRLDDPNDFVRLEIESALARKIRVIPVLVEDAPRPRAEDLPASLATLVRRNAIELSDTRWAYDVDRLAQTIQQILEDTGASRQAMAVQPPARGAPAGVAAVARAWMYRLAAVVLMSTVVLVPTGREPARQIQLNPIVDPSPEAVQPPSDGGNMAGQNAKGVSSEGPKAREFPAVTPKNKPERPKPPVPIEVQSGPSESPPSEPSVIITSPKTGDRIGERFKVRGTASGLGTSYRAFLCFRRPGELMFDSCEEVPAMNDGLFALTMVRASKEKSFELLIVIASNGEAAESLSDRTQGLRSLPPGAKITGSIALKRQGWISEVFTRGR